MIEKGGGGAIRLRGTCSLPLIMQIKVLPTPRVIGWSLVIRVTAWGQNELADLGLWFSPSRTRWTAPSALVDSLWPLEVQQMAGNSSMEGVITIISEAFTH